MGDDFDFDGLGDFSIDGGDDSFGFDEPGGSSGGLSDNMMESLDDAMAFNTGASSDNDGTSEFGKLGNKDKENRKLTVKTSIVAIVCGLLLIVVIFGAINLITNLTNKKNNPVETEAPGQEDVLATDPGGDVEQPQPQPDPVQPQPQPEPVQPQPQPEPQPQPVQPQPQPVQPQPDVNSSGTSNSDGVSGDGWMEFSTSDGMTFSENFIDCKFTVTGIKHYVKVLEDSNLKIKTTLTGALAGFSGTFTLDIPYSKGQYLSIGDGFDTQVKVGTTSEGITVVDEIKF